MVVWGIAKMYMLIFGEYSPNLNSVNGNFIFDHPEQPEDNPWHTWQKLSAQRTIVKEKNCLCFYWIYVMIFFRQFGPEIFLFCQFRAFYKFYLNCQLDSDVLRKTLKFLGTVRTFY